MNDQIQVVFGADTTALAAGLRGIKGSLEDMKHNVKESFADLGKEIAGAFGVIGIISTLEKVSQKVEQIKRVSEGSGVSTGFFQDLVNAGKDSGVTGEQLEKALGIFTKSLSVGEDVEEEFNKVADQFAAIQDPVERAQKAFELFGKSGAQLIPILAQGSTGIKEMAASFSKLSEEEIKAVEEAHQNIEKFENNLTIWAGKFVSAVATAGKAYAGFVEDIRMGEAFGSNLQRIFNDEAKEKSTAEAGKAAAQQAAKLAAAAEQERKDREEINAAMVKYREHLQDIQLKSSDVSYQEKRDILNNRYEQAVSSIKLATDDKERLESLTKMADIKEQLLDLAKKESDELSKQNDKTAEMNHKLEEAQNRLANAQRERDQAFTDRTSWTVSDLSQRGGNTFAARTARTIQNLENNSKNARNYGNTEYADALETRALELRRSISYALTSSESDPMGKVNENLEHLKKTNDALLFMAMGKGININIPDQ